MYGVTADLGFAHTPRMAIKVAHYLTPVTGDCGLTMFLPGSHLLTQEPGIPADAADPDGALTPDLQDGDAVLFENRTWHASGINLSGRPRIALMLQYGYRWLQPVDDPATDLLADPALSPIERQLVGMPDRNPDGSLAKGAGAAPLHSWWHSME
jgi:ectoine hydroxylase-related dioxygenase (phytanoyl-CoA dioxygenase family)